MIHSTIHHPHPIHHTSPQDRNVGTQNVADLCKQVPPEKTKKKKKHKKAKRRQLEKATPSGTHFQNVPKERPKINNNNTQTKSVSPPKWKTLGWIIPLGTPQEVQNDAKKVPQCSQRASKRHLKIS